VLPRSIKIPQVMTLKTLADRSKCVSFFIGNIKESPGMAAQTGPIMVGDKVVGAITFGHEHGNERGRPTEAACHFVRFNGCKTVSASFSHSEAISC